jgi:signal transduction histidine kinase
VKIKLYSRSTGGSPSEFRLIIADDGPGIAPEHRDRIFEPFFSTKPEKGSGLGLWMARGIANKYGGSIRVRSNTAAESSWTCVAVKMPTQRAFSNLKK